MQFIRQRFDLNLKPIREYLQACELPFKQSQLYSAVEKKKFEDQSVRKSKFRLITDSVRALSGRVIRLE
jgi:hypothetical protein